MRMPCYQAVGWGNGQKRKLLQNESSSTPHHAAYPALAYAAVSSEPVPHRVRQKQKKLKKKRNKETKEAKETKAAKKQKKQQPIDLVGNQSVQSIWSPVDEKPLAVKAVTVR